MKQLYFWLLAACMLAIFGEKARATPNNSADSAYIAENYDKVEHKIPMRDGVHLFTIVYTPKNAQAELPIMLHRTPYSAGPYGDGKMRTSLGPSMLFAKEQFIFVYQDVRGRFMSEGEYENMRPHLSDKPNKHKSIDESTDTFDTIKWLLRHLKGHNGKVGMWGISYPGFYAIAGAIDAHPALVAVSPQAPIADFFFDDFHHHGAFFLPHAFNFLASFDQPRRGPTQTWGKRFDHGTPDGYQFFMNMGPLKNANALYFGDSLAFWNQLEAHPNYDDYWKARNILPHLKRIQPAVLTVGGWFDAEDLYGPLKIYQETEKNSPKGYNGLVMGPWKHGGWARTDGTSLGNVFFGDLQPPSEFFQMNIELPFFLHFLKEKGEHKLPEAYMFETGQNDWQKFDVWPPKDLFQRKLFLHGKQQAGFVEYMNIYDEYEEFVSDPNKPVPFTEAITTKMTAEYMTDDQRFAARRPDVLVFQTEPFDHDMTVAGPLEATIYVSTTGTDADWIVKIIDVYPDNEHVHEHQPDKPMGGYQQMVRSEVIRGRFRNSYEKPEPFVPGHVTEIRLPLQDVLHRFRKGHRMMVQIQSSWFPLVDRNPQTYVENIFQASEDDFKKATHRVYHSALYPSHISFGTLGL